MKARYNRISSSTQKLDRQKNKATDNELIFNDVVSGSIPFSEREQGSKLIEAVELGEVDYISVSSIDRLGRNNLDILQTVQRLNDSGVTLKVDNLGIESRTDGKPNQVFNLIISVMSSISEMERTAILERQREGISIAKAKGTYKGRIKGSSETPQQILSKYKQVVRHLNAKQSLRNTAALSGVSLATVQKVKALIKSTQ
ncbi:recombinase family protein [Arenibacter sp. TNZ]|uniref:recombinase family protein n=1 Tax=Arenibacter TaxID=178469 RepID=UPI000CD442CD|nr:MULTISPECIES: recombinase family protein [Arenibacter]MCM4170959.1 recombinase family protein [Arenibacter sp. TNZ]